MLESYHVLVRGCPRGRVFWYFTSEWRDCCCGWFIIAVIVVVELVTLVGFLRVVFRLWIRVV